MIIDWTISLGSMIQIFSMVILVVAGYYALKSQLAIFQQTLHTHAVALDAHTARLTKIDEQVIGIIGDLQRLIGRSEIFFRRQPGGVWGDDEP